MDAKILQKWGLKATDFKDSSPSSPVSLSSRETGSVTAVDYKALQAWLPPIPPFERQRLSSHTLQDLRYACAVVLKETTPSDADLDQTDPLEEYRKAIARTEKPEKPKDTKKEQEAHKHRKDSPRISGTRKSSSKPPNIDVGSSHAPSKAAVSQTGAYSVDATSTFPEPPKRDTHNATSSSTQDYYRQPQHKAASSDYILHDTARTSTTNPGSSTNHSAQDTNVTSFSQSPHDTLHSSYHRSIGFPSKHHTQTDPLPIRPGSSSQAGAKHTVWVTGGRSQREHEDAATTAVPRLHKTASRSSLRSQTGLRSRAGSIRDNIKEYIRPGSSRGSSRPPTSRSAEPPNLTASSSSRPESRQSHASSSAEGKRSWWKATGLRKRASATFRRNSVSGELESEPTSPDQENGAVDLDKSLPPMPSLDSYVEPPKEPKLHISQLMVPVLQTPPTVPQNSLTSPANLVSPPGIRSPTSFHAAQGSPRTAQTPKQHAIRSSDSPALTPGTGNQTPTLSSRSRPDTKSRSRQQMDHSQSENGHAGEQARTFYSNDHQAAATNLTQFSDAWRESLVQKETDRRLRRERDRQAAKEYKKRTLESKQKERQGDGTDGKDSPKDSVKIKHRISRMFGHSKQDRRPQTAPAMPEVPPMPEAPPMPATLERTEEPDRGRGREVVAN